jgi:hypothetical protein
VVSGQDGDQSTLNVLDAHTGVQKASVQVPAGLVPAAFSTDGRRIALAPANSDTGRDQTRIVIADPSGAVAPRTFDLPGNYEPDAFANDNQHLFVLEYQPPVAPERYSVRSLDLETGAVSGLGSRSNVACTCFRPTDRRSTRSIPTSQSICTHVTSPRV